MAEKKLTYDVLAQDDLSDKMGKMASAVEKLAAQMSKLSHQASSAGSGLTGAGNAASKAAAGLQQAANGAQNVGQHVSRAGQMASEAGERFRGMAMTIASFVGNVAANAFTALVSKIAQAGKSIVALGISTAASNQTASISFEILLGSAQKATAFLKQIQDFAAATPFDLPTLKDAASRLLAVGTNAKDIIPIMTRIGDATSGMGTGAQGIERAVYALQQMKLAGKASLEDINQLTDAGIPALDALAAHYHKTVAQVRDMISAGKVSAVDMFAAIEKGEGASFARLKGMMDKQSATLAGVWSTFKDNASQSLAKAFEPAIPTLTKLVNWAGTALPQVLGKIDFAGMLGGLEGAFTRVKGFIDRIRPYVSEVLGMFKNEAGYVNFGASFKTIATDAEKLSKTIKEHWPEIKEIIGIVVGAVLGVAKAIFTVIDWTIKLQTVMIGVWSGVVDTVNVAVLMILGAIYKILDATAIVAEKLHLPIANGMRAAANAVADESARIQGIINNLHGKSITITITEKYQTIGSSIYNQQVPYAARGHAAGGWASGWSWVGEKGPELAFFGRPAYIVPNAQIRGPVAPVGRPMAGTGGGTTLAVTGPSMASSDADRLLAGWVMRLLRTGQIQIRTAA